MNQNERVAFARQRLAGGGSIDEILLALREEGCSMGESTLILADAKGIDMDEAKRLVVSSNTWSDHRNSYDSLEDALWETGMKLGEEQEDGSYKINLSDL